LEEKRRRHGHSHRHKRYWKRLSGQTRIIIIIGILVALGLWIATAAVDISPGGGGQPIRHHR
jgi:hypothetical protein